MLQDVLSRSDEQSPEVDDELDELLPQPIE
jgi:hypothetical protein